LRNSLSYVGLLTTSPGFNDRDFRLGALATVILRLSLDSSAPSQQAVEERLLDLAVQPPVEADQGTAQALISHVRLLKILLPSVDDTIKGLFAVHTGPPLEETRAQFARLHTASESSAQRFRLLLYATSVLLALALIDLGRRLRARAVALRRRAAFEHLIAEQSARLITDNLKSYGSAKREIMPGSSIVSTRASTTAQAVLICADITGLAIAA
jgi:hypothetical protein